MVVWYRAGDEPRGLDVEERRKNEDCLLAPLKHIILVKMEKRNLLSLNSGKYC